MTSCSFPLSFCAPLLTLLLRFDLLLANPASHICLEKKSYMRYVVMKDDS